MTWQVKIKDIDNHVSRIKSHKTTLNQYFEDAQIEPEASTRRDSLPSMQALAAKNLLKFSTDVRGVKFRPTQNKVEQVCAQADITFEKLDTDKNGLVSPSEMVMHNKANVRILSYFEKLDTDGDGNITKGEFREGARIAVAKGEI